MAPRSGAAAPSSLGARPTFQLQPADASWVSVYRLQNEKGRQKWESWKEWGNGNRSNLRDSTPDEAADLLICSPSVFAPAATLSTFSKRIAECLPPIQHRATT